MHESTEDIWYLNGKKVTKKQLLIKSYNGSVNNGITIALQSSYGSLQVPIRKNVYFINEDTMLYISGKHIVLYDTTRKRQAFILKQTDDDQVMVLNYAIKQSSNLLVGMSFKPNLKVLPAVKVYNHKKQKYYSLVHSHLQPNSCIQEIAFLGYGKNCITLAKSDDGLNMTLFIVKKEFVQQRLKLNDAVSLICPLSSSEFVIQGQSYMRLFTCSNGDSLNEDANIGLNQLRQGENFICCTNVMEMMIVAITSLNRFLVYKDLKFLQAQDCNLDDPQKLKPIQMKGSKQPVRQFRDAQISVSTICGTSKGVIVGTNGKPILQVYEFNEKWHLVFKGSYCIKDEDIYGINSIDLAQDEMYAAVSVVHHNRNKSNNESGRVELYTFNLAIVEALRTVHNEPFEALFDNGVHKGTVSNVSVCPLRSVFATISEDRSFKLWEYGGSIKGLFTHQFNETPSCMALHPSSFMCAVGFKDSMRIYFVQDDDIKLVFTENMKNCNVVAFSDGGHLLAVSNQTLVCIYNPFIYRLLFSFSNHQANIRDLYFQDEDTKLVSTCILGILYVWNLQKGNNRLVEHSLKVNKYNVVVYDAYYDLIIGASPDYKLRVYSDKGQTLVIEYDTTPTIFTCICVSVRQSAIYMGTTIGTIRIYGYPFYHFAPKLMEYVEVSIHQGPITSIRVSPDYHYLITAGADGSIFISKIKQFLSGIENQQQDLLTLVHELGTITAKLMNIYSMNPLSLTSLLTKEQRKDKIKELDFRLQNFKTDIDDEKERALVEYNQLIAKQEQNNTVNVNQIREVLQNSIKESDQAALLLKNEVLDFKKKGRDSLDKMEEEHSKDLIQLYVARDKLQLLQNGIQEKQKEQKVFALKEYQSSLNEVDEEYLHKYQELMQRFNDAISNMKSDQRKFKEVLQQGEREYESFYKQCQQELQDELTGENKRTEDLRSQISKFGKENERLQHRRDFLEGLIKDSTNQVNNLQQELETYQQKQRVLQLQLSEKEDTINQREIQIKDFRMKNVHLQNFQKVYDYRVTTLKEEKEPLLDHLRNMDKHVRSMYNELIDEAGQKQQQAGDHTKQDQELKDIRHRLTKQLEQVSLSKRLIESFEFELTQVLNDKVGNWRVKIADILQRLKDSNKSTGALKNSVFSSTIKDKDPLQEAIENNTNDEIQNELTSQKNFLKKKLVVESGTVSKSLESRQQTYYAIQSTNTLLINECNQLRDTKLRLKDHIDQQTKALRKIRRELTPHGIYVPQDPEEEPMDVSVEPEQWNQWPQQEEQQRPLMGFEIEKQSQQILKHSGLYRNASESKKLVMQKTSYAQYEEQKNHKFSSKVFKPVGKFIDIYKEVKNNTDEQCNQLELRDRFRQKANAFLRPVESQSTLPIVVSHSNAPPISQSSKSRQTAQPLDSRQQLLTAGVTQSRNTMASTNINFFIQTHTSQFSLKTPIQTAATSTRKTRKPQK